MTLWWIGNLGLLLVIPVALVLVNGVLAPIERIRDTVDDILDNAVALTERLDNVPELLTETDETVNEVAVGAIRYEDDLQRLLQLKRSQV